MAPYVTTTITQEERESRPELVKTAKIQACNNSKLFLTELKWLNIVSITIIHLIALYAFITFPYFSHWKTLIYTFVIGGIGGFGVTAGAHRFWCHRSFKATLPLRIILMCCYSVAGQNTPLEWVRDHRVHHKFSETDADPHNSNRGFFFAHVGWLMMKKHPEVISKGKQVDCSDLWDDSVFVFHQKYFVPMKMLFCFILPIIIPPLCWKETWFWATIASIARYTVNLNCTWLVNSAAHMWGHKPYNKKINPVENLSVALAAMGEGWHNYHHTFPWDYKAAELGNYKVNITTMWLDFFAKLGWAYDLKAPSKELVRKVIANQGDGTHPIFGHAEVPESAELELNCFHKKAH